MRLFAAVRASSQVAQNLGHWVDRMKDSPEIPPNTKWVLEGNFHFTLKFFGEVGDPMIQDLQNALSSSPASSPFDITLKSIGAFPSLSHPRVIWAGVEDASGGLARMAQAVEDATLAAGFAASDKPFSPHLTLARLNHSARPGLPKILERHQEAFFGTMTVDHFALIHSTLAPKGAQYRDLQKWSLK